MADVARGRGIEARLQAAEDSLFTIEREIALHAGNPPVRLANAARCARGEVNELRRKYMALAQARRDFLANVLSHPVIGQVGLRFVPLSGVRIQQADEDRPASALGELVPPEFAILKHRVFGGRTVVQRESLENLTEGLRALGRVVIQGPPGSGKTILLQRFAWEQASSSLGNESSDVFPLFLPLGDWPVGTGIQDWIESLIRMEYHAELIAEDFPAMVNDARFIFILDAVNELALVGEPSRLLEISDFLEHLPGQTRVVITCRPWNELPAAMSYQRVELLPLSQSRTRELLTNILGEQAASELRARIKGTPLEELATLPYFARMLAFVVEQDGVVPSSQGTLIENFLTVALVRESRRTSSYRGGDHVVLGVLGDLAFRAQAELGSGAGMSTEWARRKLHRILADSSPSFPLDPREYLRLAADANIGIISADWATFRFAHQVLGEWLVGQHILGQFRVGADLAALWRVDLREPDDKASRIERTWRVAIPPPAETGWERPTILAAGTLPEADELITSIVRTNPLLAAQCTLETSGMVRAGVTGTVIDGLLGLAGSQDYSVRARVVAGDLLGRLGDPRTSTPPVYVPAGAFLMGTGKPDPHGGACPEHEVQVAGFAIDMYPVTYQRYRDFLQDGGYERQGLWTEQGWRWLRATGNSVPELWEHPDFFGLNRPVIGVNWHEASAFAAWAGGRLPTEAEWEKAAAWDPVAGHSRRFPWGDDWDGDAANCRDSRELAGRTTPVGVYPSGMSAHRVMDLAGNVWEWTSSAYLPYPYRQDDGREDTDAAVNRVLRGGTFWSSREFLECGSRFRTYPDYRFDVAGFRVAYDVL